MFNDPLMLVSGTVLAGYLGFSRAPFRWQGAILLAVILILFSIMIIALTGGRPTGEDFGSYAGYAVGTLLGVALLIVPVFIGTRLARHLIRSRRT